MPPAACSARSSSRSSRTAPPIGLLLVALGLTFTLGQMNVINMGRNGVGKSTLLQTIVGLQPARAGTISLGWEEITKAPRTTA